MLFSYKWLQEHFEDPLPEPNELALILTSRAFEVEGVEKKEGDTVIDIDILPNRASDCLSHHGVAREISALLEIPISRPKHFSKKGGQRKKKKEVEVEVAEPLLCRRYLAQKISNITVEASPLWMQEKLSSLGQKSINNIVDATNIVMFETGQPLHAFDADKLDGGIVVRKSKEGDELTTLDEKKLVLSPNTLVIADQKAVLAIAGVKGGTKAEVTPETKNIILEAANFDPQIVRRATVTYGIRTDASKRFENTVPFSSSKEGLEMVSDVIALNQEDLQNKDGKKKKKDTFKMSAVLDIAAQERKDFVVAVTVQGIADILGEEIPEKEIEHTLKRLGFTQKKESAIETILNMTKESIGAPYAYTGPKERASFGKPRAFDSGSLVSSIFSAAGFTIPKIPIDQYLFGEEVEEKDMDIGDVIFSNTSDEYTHFESKHWFAHTKVPEGVDHAGIYIGDGQVVHACRKDQCVEVESISESPQFRSINGVRRMFSHDEQYSLWNVPAWRLDIKTLADVAEEVGRVWGYDKILGKPLTDDGFSPSVLNRFFLENTIRNILFEEGFSELYLYTLSAKGDVRVAKPPAKDKAYLRTDLSSAIEKALDRNSHYAPLLGEPLLKVFELGVVWNGELEELHLSLGVRDTERKKTARVSEVFKRVGEHFSTTLPFISLGEPNNGIVEISLDEALQKMPQSEGYLESLKMTSKENHYRPISPYPFLLRDIAVFIPRDEDPSVIEQTIKEKSGELLARFNLFDVFEKEFENGEKKTSYAYHIVLQSNEKTLSDEEGNKIMEQITASLSSREGFLVR